MHGFYFKFMIKALFIILIVLLCLYYFVCFLQLFINFCFRFFRFLFVFLKYVFYVIFYILQSLIERDLFEWEESFFYTRPTSEDLATSFEQQGFSEDLDVMMTWSLMWLRMFLFICSFLIMG